MPASLKNNAWWVWLLPTILGADAPLLAVGFGAAHVTDQPFFTLWGWLGALCVTGLSAWMASRGTSYGYWLGSLSSLTGICYLVFYRMLWIHRGTFYANLPHLPFQLGTRLNLDILLMRDVGLAAISVGVLFIVYDAIAQRWS